MVFQYPEYQLFAETVFADVAFGLKNFRKGITAEETEAAVRDALEIVGLSYEEVKDKSPFDLSGGQKRRVAIAGVIVTRPHILILDEPAAGLDPLGKQEIMELLHKLHREWCRTVIVVSHDMDEITRYANRLIIFGDGKVAFDVPMTELFKHGSELEELGLETPSAVRMANALKARGVDLGEGIVNMDTFTAAVLEKLRQKGEKVGDFSGIDWFGEKNKENAPLSDGVFGEGV